MKPLKKRLTKFSISHNSNLDTGLTTKLQLFVYKKVEDTILGSLLYKLEDRIFGYAWLRSGLLIYKEVKNEKV